MNQQARITIKTKAGGNVVEVTSTSQKAAIQGMAFFGELPSCCPRCAQEHNKQVPYTFTFREWEGNFYYGAICQNGHQTTFGQHKQGDTLFYKADEQWQTLQEIKNSRQNSNQNYGNQQQPQQQQNYNQQGGYQPTQSTHNPTPPGNQQQQGQGQPQSAGNIPANFDDMDDDLPF